MWRSEFSSVSSAVENICINRRFLEITGVDNLTVFSYSGRVKSPEWRWQWRRADLRHFEIFRHGPIIIYTRLPAGGTYYPICTFPASSECLINISDAFSAFCLWVSVIFPTCSLYPQRKRAYSALHPQGVYQCPAILSLIVGAYVRFLIRVSLSLFLWRFLLLFGYNYCDWM